MSYRQLVRRVVPISARIACVRLRTVRQWRREQSQFDTEKEPPDEHQFVLAEHRSPLRRAGTTYAEDLQLGKETNVAVAATLIDGLVIPPGGEFSYHHAVGSPTRSRGFVLGAELRDGALAPGIGGGCCQVSNLLFVLALLAGATITERHRHGLDLFPDSERTVPFGCGATVFFPTRDLRFRNELDQPIRIGLTITDGFLVGKIQTRRPASSRFEIFEIASEMRREGTLWIRENLIGRRAIATTGEITVDEVAHNVARCLYEPVVRQEA